MPEKVLSSSSRHTKPWQLATEPIIISGKKIHLSSQDYEETTEEVQALLVVSLHDSNGADRVRVTPTIRHPTVSKYGDDYMFLHVERPRVQAETPPENLELPPWKSRSHEFSDGQHRNLHENGGYGERLRAVGEEGVEKYEERT